VPYLTAAQVRSRIPQLASTTNYPTSELESLVTEFEEIAERYLGVAFLPRTVTDEKFVQPNNEIKLEHPRIRSVSAFSIDGVAGSLTDLKTDNEVGLISGPTWYGANVVLVTYTHGFTTPPEILLRACAEYCRAVAFADRSGQSRDVIAQSFDGSMTRYSTPSWQSKRPTGFLEIDRLLNSAVTYAPPGVG
jgi:hypothetical protein